ncbi:MAG: thymidylate synthase [Ktedonobacteraceae bacterium]|nr:thymidylate synthase [Ktedonobacteraceae bacterium]
MHIQADTMDEVQRLALHHIFERGRRVQPRGIWVSEITSASFQLLQPRARLIYSPSRVHNITFAIGELLWYLRGSDQADIVSFYNPRYTTFSDDGRTLHGAYGRRIFSSALTGIVQWDAVLHLLRTDRDTRQAVLHFHLPSDLVIVSRDIPCTCSMQFFIRENKLECLVMMRSNDIIWGTPYDVFSFTMMQEIMAKQLGIELGPYTHMVGSFHLYDRHIKLAQKILSESSYDTYPMPEMPPNPWQSIRELLEIEESLRVLGVDASDGARTCLTHPYWKDFAHLLHGHAAWRAKNEHHLAHMLALLPPQYATLLQRQILRQRRLLPTGP